MSHLSDGEIAALLDGELTENRVRRVERHLEDCDRCDRRREELADISDRLDTTLERGLEPPADIASAAGEPERWSLYGGLKAAAAVILLVGVGALAADAALPGSPLRDLVVRAVDELPGVDRPVPTVEPPVETTDRSRQTAGAADTAPREAARPARRGLAVPPACGELVLRIVGAAEGTRVRIEITEESRGGISARGGTFRTNPGRLAVVNPAPGEIRVSAPRSGEWRLEIDSRTVLRRSGGRLVRPDGSVVEDRSGLLLRVGGG